MESLKNCKKLGFGFMRLPDKPGTKDLDLEQAKAMVDYYLEKGYTYFDTALPYHGGKSESSLKTCLVDRHPRESFTIATKMTEGFLREDFSAKDMLYQSLENLGVEYVDYYLLHALNRKRMALFDEIKVWDFLQEEKAKGRIRHVGFSFHDKAEVLEQALSAHPEIEFVQLQLNYADWDNDMIQARLCYEIARKHEKPIIVMEPVRGGMLASLVPEAEEIFKNVQADHSISKWALRFVAGLEGVEMVLSGMSNLAQVEENIDTFETFTPLNPQEQQAVKEVVAVLDAIPTIPCTDCKYCVKDCPAQINIPQFFRIMNIHLRHDGLEAPTTNLRGFKFATNKGQPKPSACVACGRCETACPQGIEIIKELVRVKDCYEPLL